MNLKDIKKSKIDYEDIRNAILSLASYTNPPLDKLTYNYPTDGMKNNLIATNEIKQACWFTIGRLMDHFIKDHFESGFEQSLWAIHSQFSPYRRSSKTNQECAQEIIEKHLKTQIKNMITEFDYILRREYSNIIAMEIEKSKEIFVLNEQNGNPKNRKRKSSTIRSL